MDANQSNSPVTPEYRTLGKKTFIIFFLDRVRVGVVFLILAIVLFVLSSQNFLANLPSIGDLRGYALMGGWWTLLIAIVALLIAFFVSWLIYINYRFALQDDSLKIKRGVLNKEEIAIPYRQIQDVDIERDLTYQMLGMSRLAILTAGHEDEPR